MSLVAGLRGRFWDARGGLSLVRERKPLLERMRVSKPMPGRRPVEPPWEPPFRPLSGIPKVRGELLRSPWGRLLHLGRRAGTAMSMLFGNKFRFARCARGARIQLHRQSGARGGVLAAIAERLAASASRPAHRAVAADLREAAGAGDLERAARIVRHAEQLPDMEAEKIVSRKHRFLWIGNPKVATQSLSNALCQADPDVEVFRKCSVNDLLGLRPEIRGYFSFAFVRDPFRRAVSLHEHMFVPRPSLAAERLEPRYCDLSEDMDFEAFCAWLAGPYGADAFADRHWVSQHVQIATAAGRMPDFVGRHETIEDDFRTVTRQVGLPDLRLPRRNTAEQRARSGTGPRPSAKELLTDRARGLLRRRYAVDFRVFGYDPE